MRALLLLHAAAALTALVTGATGRTGVLTYAALKKAGATPRALVRNATKAKALLGCDKCDESEGIFVGDLTKPESLTAAMQGVDALVITVGPVAVCGKLGPIGCHYAKGGDPKTVLWEGLKAQVSAFAAAGPLAGKRVVLMSSGLTTEPDNFLDKLGGGHVTFYSLNGEAFLMGSGVDFTIVKACGLSDKPAGKHKLIVGHDDQLPLAIDHAISRADVANVLAAAVSSPDAKNNRFDLCSQEFGRVDANLNDLFVSAEYPWNKAKAAMVI